MTKKIIKGNNLKFEIREVARDQELIRQDVLIYFLRTQLFS